MQCRRLLQPPTHHLQQQQQQLKLQMQQQQQQQQFSRQFPTAPAAAGLINK